MAVAAAAHLPLRAASRHRAWRPASPAATPGSPRGARGRAPGTHAAPSAHGGPSPPDALPSDGGRRTSGAGIGPAAWHVHGPGAACTRSSRYGPFSPESFPLQVRVSRGPIDPPCGPGHRQLSLGAPRRIARSARSAAGPATGDGAPVTELLVYTTTTLFGATTTRRPTTTTVVPTSTAAPATRGHRDPAAAAADHGTEARSCPPADHATGRGAGGGAHGRARDRARRGREVVR